mgnify:CR=1 FL=1
MNKAELREKLEAQLGEADWGDLEPHAERGALIFVSFEKELIDVAVAVAVEDRLARGGERHRIFSYRRLRFFLPTVSTQPPSLPRFPPTISGPTPTRNFHHQTVLFSQRCSNYRVDRIENSCSGDV